MEKNKNKKNVNKSFRMEFLIPILISSIFALVGGIVLIIGLGNLNIAADWVNGFNVIAPIVLGSLLLASGIITLTTFLILMWLESNSLIQYRKRIRKREKIVVADDCDKKIIKALSKEQKGKSLSYKERIRISEFKSKYTYDATSDIALDLKNVKKKYGNKEVLKGVTMCLKKGEKVGLIGKNGSGKSTLITILSQQLKMSEGSIFYGYAKNRTQSLELMGVQFQKLEYPEGFVVKDVIHFFNVSVEKEIRLTKKQLQEMISTFGIEKFMEQRIDRLSGGQQQRINILLALIKRPKLLVLDELSTGLDVESAEVIKRYLVNYFNKNPETTLLLISHSADELKEMTDNIYVLENGTIVEKFKSSELSTKKFLEITSRELKLTSDEVKVEEDKSEVLLKKLNKYYTNKVQKPDEIYEESVITKYTKKYMKLSNEFMDKDNLVEVRNVSKTYGRSVCAVDAINLDIKAGSRITITGPNGSGKTTLAEIIAQVKGFDSQGSKFRNLHNTTLHKYKMLNKKNHDAVKLELHKFRQLQLDAKNEKAKILKKNLTPLDFVRLKKFEKTEERNDLKVQEQPPIEDLEKIRQIKTWKEYNLKLKIDYKKYKSSLIEKLKVSEEKLLLRRDAELRNIKKKKEEYLNDKNIVHFNKFIMNGKVIPAITKTTNKPQIAYAFSDNKRGVKDFTGMQFQTSSFPIEMSVIDVILFFSRTNKVFMSKEEIIAAVKVFKLEKLLKHKTFKLSGGERQRLNILLAIMKSPKLLILDEISTGLDVDSIVKIDEFIKDYLDKSGATLILISHNYHEIHSLTDRLVVMRFGKLHEIVDTDNWTLSQIKDKMRDIYRGEGI